HGSGDLAHANRASRRRIRRRHGFPLARSRAATQPRSELGLGAALMIPFFKRYVLHNFTLKVLSLLIAAGLWFMIAPDEQLAEVALRAPIVFQHVPAHLEISSPSIPDAQIRVRGPERVIRRLQANEVHAEIDLAG